MHLGREIWFWGKRSDTDLEANTKDFIVDMVSLKQENINLKITSSFSKIFMKHIIYKLCLEETLMVFD